MALEVARRVRLVDVLGVVGEVHEEVHGEETRDSSGLQLIGNLGLV